jgi:hypothetical protein
LCDLLTDQKLAMLPLSGVQFDRRISRTGSLNGKFDASTPALVNMARLCHAYAGRSALWVYRNNELWWGGIPWTVPVAQGDRGPITANITAATFDSYAHHRMLYANKTYNQVDQGAIIPDLWRTIQADPSGDIGMVAEDQPTGVLRDRAYLVSDQNYVGKLVEDLGDVIDGPEHTVDVYLDGAGSRIKRVRLANRLGNTDPKVVFQRARGGGGRVTSWVHTADAVDGGTTFQTRGDAPPTDIDESGEPLLSARFERSDLLAAGWPRLDVVADYAGVSDVTTLNGYAQGLSVEHGGSMRTAGYTVDVGTTGWTPNQLGDAVRIKIADLWHATTDETVRPVGCAVTPPEKGAAEQVTLLLGDED